MEGRSWLPLSPCAPAGLSEWDPEQGEEPVASSSSLEQKWCWPALEPCWRGRLHIRAAPPSHTHTYVINNNYEEDNQTVKNVHIHMGMAKKNNDE